MDISKLNKADVLATLYNRSRPLGMGFLHFTPEDMTPAEAQQMLDAGQTHFDYVKGRVLKVHLDGDEMKTALYNRDNGDQAAEMAPATLIAAAA